MEPIGLPFQIMKNSTKLTGQERVNRCFARTDIDRFPRFESFWPETIERWENEGLVGGLEGVLNLLETDFQSLSWIWPQAFPLQNDLVEQDEKTRVMRDGNGKLVRYWRGKSGTPEHLGFDCDSREKWEKIYKPGLISNALQVDPEAIRRNYLQARERGLWCHLTGAEVFEEIRALLGDINGLIAMAEEPEWIEDIVTTFTNALMRNMDACMATGIQPDGLWMYADMAYNHSTMCSPQMYRDLFWPAHKKLADWAHAHGMKFIFHTDGDVNGVIDHYIEAGIDALQPLESKANMDIRKLLPKYADRLCFFGNIDVMKMIPNDLAIIEEEIVSKFSVAKKTRGYIYHSDHSVPPQVTWKTYQAIIEMINKHGNYD